MFKNDETPPTNSSEGTADQPPDHDTNGLSDPNGASDAAHKWTVRVSKGDVAELVGSFVSGEAES